MKVTVHFGPRSEVTALQRTKLVRRGAPGAGTIPDGYDWSASLEINPGFTELFIEGTAHGFSMNFQSESAPSTDVVFENGFPTAPYDKVYKCFKENGNGLLFRLMNSADNTWAFYNDTKNFIMKVTVDFELSEEVKVLGSTTVNRATPSSYGAKGVLLQLAVQPGKTELFISGSPRVYKLSFAADPAEDEAPQEDIAYLNGTPDANVVPHCSHVYKCFKENSNGLMFHIVDDVHKIWAFYNDTKDYEMTVNVSFPSTADVQLAPGVQSFPDKDKPGRIITAVQVPPLETVPFLVGAPKDYELAFSATAANRSMPDANVLYDFGGPDKAVIQADETYKCFKNHGNGLLFRLVDTKNRRWAFYNDTNDVVVTVKVSFPKEAEVKPLGSTKLGTDEELGVVFVLDVKPRETALFAEGDMKSFTTTFTARK